MVTSAISCAMAAPSLMAMPTSAAADVVADVCLADPRVERVTVSVRKFGTVLGLGSAEVKITRPV